MATFDYQGFSIHYTIEGEGNPIVFLHGLGGSVMNWIYQRNHFKKTHQVISIDLPGHGKSEGASELTFFDYHKILKELLLDELYLEGMILCGLSMGGKAAIDFASRYHDAIRGLIIADSFASIEGEEKRKLQATWDLIHQPGGVDTWMKTVIHQMGLDPEGAIAKGFHKGIESHPVEFLYELFTQLVDYDQSDQLDVISAPSLVIHGEKDEFAPRSSAEGMHQGLKGSEYHIIPNSGHLPNVEQPQAFNELVEGFIKRL